MGVSEREEWVNNMTTYAKTHEDWDNLEKTAAVRSILWVVVSDESAYLQLRKAMADLEETQ